jgi:hypothetical protein
VVTQWCGAANHLLRGDMSATFDGGAKETGALVRGQGAHAHMRYEIHQKPE